MAVAGFLAAVAAEGLYALLCCDPHPLSCNLSMERHDVIHQSSITLANLCVN